jgi:hypothetical protein
MQRTSRPASTPYSASSPQAIARLEHRLDRVCGAQPDWLPRSLIIGSKSGRSRGALIGKAARGSEARSAPQFKDEAHSSLVTMQLSAVRMTSVSIQAAGYKEGSIRQLCRVAGYSTRSHSS